MHGDPFWNIGMGKAVCHVEREAEELL
jgi:hypothetical protein